jgi:hypothetical protein
MKQLIDRNKLLAFVLITLFSAVLVTCVSIINVGDDDDDDRASLLPGDIEEVINVCNGLQNISLDIDNEVEVSDVGYFSFSEDTIDNCSDLAGLDLSVCEDGKTNLDPSIGTFCDADSNNDLLVEFNGKQFSFSITIEELSGSDVYLEGLAVSFFDVEGEPIQSYATEVDYVYADEYYGSVDSFTLECSESNSSPLEGFILLDIELEADDTITIDLKLLEDVALSIEEVCSDAEALAEIDSLEGELAAALYLDYCTYDQWGGNGYIGLTILGTSDEGDMLSSCMVDPGEVGDLDAEVLDDEELPDDELEE